MFGFFRSYFSNDLAIDLGFRPFWHEPGTIRSRLHIRRGFNLPDCKAQA